MKKRLRIILTTVLCFAGLSVSVNAAPPYGNHEWNYVQLENCSINRTYRKQTIVSSAINREASSHD